MNPIELAREIEERYRRYLKTTFYFKDPQLRQSFEEALQSGHLSRGPFLEATPVFKRSQTPRVLFHSLLGFQTDEGFLKAVQGDRPLYQHQEEAIQKVFDGRNVVVATGTGSGKTEAFLYPILIQLYQEFQLGKLCPGVRALILYPMNALANDQRERLGEICKRLEDTNSPFRFTFGQYIGETPEAENDSLRHARDHISNRLPGDLVLRSEMRNTPPHILLTNYSMLEYLLLRPDDSPLFDDGRARWWTFLVLDEAHQYRGSRGIEMAMLLRRLKQRLRVGGRSEPFRCIATSATLVGGEGGKEEIAKFASDLFGEEFSEESVILGEPEPIPEMCSGRLNPDIYQFLGEALHRKSTEAGSFVAELAIKLGVPLLSNEDLSKNIGELLQRDSRATELRRSITGNPAEVQEIAARVFDDLPEDKRVHALSGLIELLLRTKDPVSDAPLLSVRYHLFLRSLEGAFLSYLPQKKIFLDHRAYGQEGSSFEVALCRECGQHYLVGKIINKRLVEAIRDPGHPDFGATFFRPVDDQKEDEENGSNISKQPYRLCLRCGEIRQLKEQLQCKHIEQILVERQDEMEEREDQIPRCTTCGYQAPDPVREVIHGTDGPHAVIATTLYQTLPENRKKVLAFADGRQEAAFFAWYLEDSYIDILIRNLILKTTQGLIPYTEEGLSLRELAIGLSNIFREKEVFPPAWGDLELRRKAWLTLYKEFLTDEPRISLEGLGLVGWKIKWPKWLSVPEVLTKPPWSLSDSEAQEVIYILLDSMRMDKSVEILTEQGISLNWSDLGIQSPQMRVRVGQPKGIKNVRSWDGKTGRRAHFLTKLLLSTNSNLSEEDAFNKAIDTLRAIWEGLKQCDENAPSSGVRLLLMVDDARRLNPDWWRLHLVRDDSTLHQCKVCGRLQAISVRDICPRHRCPGMLQRIHVQDLEPNHYRLLYESDLPGSLRVEEHTAQLDKERAREFQREFREGKIHVLSCSTTFELGVDLGDLDTIFLRNVPPEAFNYAQRVGRAGRRSGYPGFAITYCRRSPHDLYHFSEPARMLSGRIRPPVLSVQNEKIITRHIAAIALSAFFRVFRERFKTVESFFKDLTNPSGVTDFKAFIYEHQAELEKSLKSIVPSNMFTHTGLTDGGWVVKITGEDSRLWLAEIEVSSDYRNVKNLERVSSQMGTRDGYKLAQWANARAKTIAEEDVLSFLSRKAVIPKYGFPVDVVELDTQRTQQNHEAFEVLLQRDLSIAISEFAPTSKLVANKKVWTSYGLKKVAEKEWPLKYYKRCSRHNVFYRWDPGKPEPPTPCGDKLTPFKYIIPRFGFVTDRDKPKEPTSRTVRVFTTRPYFAGSLGLEPGILKFPTRSPLVTLRKASPGLMCVVCEGRRGERFYICGGCGAGFRRREKTHKTPYGQNCSGTLEQVSLGHEFVTDVLQLQFNLKPKDGMDPVSFAFSLAYALVEGAAEVLEVPSTDLSATVAHQEYPIPPIVLYDNVPGGAGLVARLEIEVALQDCLNAAQKRVSGSCGCDEGTSCYGCLRSYRNQFVHQNLQRGPVMYYLEGILSQWR